MSEARRQSPDYVDTLDGIRALAAFLVLTFHYWQQSWFTFAFTIFGYRIDLANVVANGAIGVEVLFVISGFCLYYPLAMHPNRPFSLGSYIYKRAVRILPTYILCVLICSAYQIGRMNPDTLREQFIANITLTQMRNPAVAYNMLNGVLWSIAIEVQFYVIFPLLTLAFRRKPWLVTAVSFVIAEVWRWYLRDIDYSRIGFLMNQLPGMIDTFIAGMLAAHITALIRCTLSEGQLKALAPAFTVATLVFALFCLLVTTYLGSLRYSDIPENLSRLRMNMRKFINVSFAGLIVCSAQAGRGVHVALGNPLARFLSGISYQLYLWHAWIALRLKDFHIPEYTTERPMDDVAWRAPYLLLALALSMIVSIGMTYLVERPISRFAMKHTPRWARPRPEPVKEEAIPDEQS